jgi:hypothetical protein
MAIREYFVLWAVGILAVFSLAIWLERMLKIVLGNYLLMVLCLTLPTALWSFLSWLNAAAPDIGQAIAPAFSNMTIIVLVVYLLLLLLLFSRGRVSIHFHHKWLWRFLLTMLCIPLTIISIATTLSVAVLGQSAFDVAALQILAAWLQVHEIYKILITQMPAIISIHVFVTVLVLSNISFPTKLPSFLIKKKPEETFELDVE